MNDQAAHATETRHTDNTTTTRGLQEGPKPSLITSLKPPFHGFCRNYYDVAWDVSWKSKTPTAFVWTIKKTQWHVTKSVIGIQLSGMLSVYTVSSSIEMLHPPPHPSHIQQVWIPCVWNGHSECDFSMWHAVCFLWWALFSRQRNCSDIKADVLKCVFATSNFFSKDTKNKNTKEDFVCYFVRLWKVPLKWKYGAWKGERPGTHVDLRWYK